MAFIPAAQRRMSTKYVFRGFALTFVAVALSPFGVTQKPKTPKEMVPETQLTASNVTPPSTHELTNEDLGAFLDGLVPSALQKEDIAGAVISVVKDGKVLFAKEAGFFLGHTVSSRLHFEVIHVDFSDAVGGARQARS
jgi:hypothetical protein